MSSMNKHDYVVFDIDGTSMAIPSVLVDKVERAVLLTPVPEAPSPVLGVVSDGGDIVPVLGLRARLGLQERNVRLSDRLLFSRCGGRRVAVLADSVGAVVEIIPEKARGMQDIWPGVLFLKSIAGLGGDVVLMQDMDAVLSSEQEFRLDEALRLMQEQDAEGISVND
ncbi:chemotaxis protein CheW [Maridesulfovibrio sp. FT414]|uniref:chemotaxis protein CheW n=1 Tax=Maridesulfovibrio sp. FT414 TaxID=2979469 RepID=UPI003D8058A0